MSQRSFTHPDGSFRNVRQQLFTKVGLIKLVSVPMLNYFFLATLILLNWSNLLLVGQIPIFDASNAALAPAA